MSRSVSDSSVGTHITLYNTEEQNHQKYAIFQAFLGVMFAKKVAAATAEWF